MRRLTMFTILAVVLLGAISVGTPVAGATLNADPRTLAQVFARAEPGDTIVLGAGEYAGVSLRGRRFAPALILDASRARFVGLKLNDLEGLTIRGGQFLLPAATNHPRTGRPTFGYAIRMDSVRNVAVHGVRAEGPGGNIQGAPFGEGYGVFVARSTLIGVHDSQFQGFRTGVVLGKVDGFRVERNRFQYMRSDGINVGEGRQGLIEGNVCSDTRIRDQEHPDCIQLWSRPTSMPTADVVIRGNRVNGWTQGIGLFNHKPDGVDDGGFDRILIEDNMIQVGHPQGIGLYASRDSIVRNNKVETLPGAKFRASINLIGGEPQRCGNTVAAAAGKPEVIDKPCKIK